MRETETPSSQSQPPVLERPDRETLSRWELNPYPGLRPKTGAQVGTPVSEYPPTTESQGASQVAALVPAVDRHGWAPKPKPTSEARNQIEGLRQLQPGWNDASPVPNQTALWLAERVLDVLDETCFPPSNVVPDAEGGVSIYFSGMPHAPLHYASLSCSNEGEVVALTHDRVGEPRVWNVGTDRSETKTAVERIRTFLLV